MDLTDINYWFLIVTIVAIIYLLVKAWHEHFFYIHQSECTLCDSKKFKRVQRNKFYKLIPFTSKKYHCKSYGKSYLIIHIFHKKYIISHEVKSLHDPILKNDP